MKLISKIIAVFVVKTDVENAQVLLKVSSKVSQLSSIDRLSTCLCYELFNPKF